MRKRYVAAISVVALGVAALALSMSVSAQRGSTDVFFAVLTGANELTEDGDRGAGDRNGRGTFSATIDGRQFCYGIQVKNIQDPNASHIHRGTARQTGPIIQPLEAPNAGDQGTSGGCTRLSASLARSIRRNPRRFYVNVHNPDYPDGAVRGQVTDAR
jgi:hypothetical protein